MNAQVTVVTVVKNSLLGLKSTVSSLFTQDYPYWKLVIIVGTSSDGTYEFAQSLEINPRIKVLEDQEPGIYQAMNRGLDHTSTEYIWFMNAGDIFSDEKCLNYSVGVADEKKAAIVMGRYKAGTQSRNPISLRQGVHPIGKFEFAFNRRLGCHQAMLFRTSAVKSEGGYNTQFKLCSDFDLILRIIDKSKAYKTSRVLANIEPGGISHQRISEVYKEKNKIRLIYIPSVITKLLNFIWTCAATFKYEMNQYSLRLRR